CWPCPWRRSPRFWCAMGCANIRKARSIWARDGARRMKMPIPDSGPRQLPLDLGHEPSHAEDDFLVGEGNALAHARILAWPHWPDGVTLLIGPTASGKSHLARIFADRSDALVV